MLKCTLLTTYRICACIIVALPVLINVIIETSLAVSFIYVPLFCLASAGVLIYIDAMLERVLTPKVNALFSPKKQAKWKLSNVQRKACYSE